MKEMKEKKNDRDEIKGFSESTLELFWALKVNVTEVGFEKKKQEGE